MVNKILLYSEVTFLDTAYKIDPPTVLVRALWLLQMLEGWGQRDDDNNIVLPLVG